MTASSTVFLLTEFLAHPPLRDRGNCKNFAGSVAVAQVNMWSPSASSALFFFCLALCGRLSWLTGSTSQFFERTLSIIDRSLSVSLIVKRTTFSFSALAT